MVAAQDFLDYRGPSRFYSAYPLPYAGRNPVRMGHIKSK